MKSLAGANPDAKPDYRSQALNDLAKLESKVILLNEMLDNVDTSRGERMVAGDVYEVFAFVIIKLDLTFSAASGVDINGSTAKDTKVDIGCRDARFGISRFVGLSYLLDIRRYDNQTHSYK